MMKPMMHFPLKFLNSDINPKIKIVINSNVIDTKRTKN